MPCSNLLYFLFLQYLNSDVNETPTVLSPMSKLINEMAAFHVSSPPQATTNGQVESPDQNEETSLRSSSSSSSFNTAEEGVWVYINGDRPTSADNLVYEIMKNLEVDAHNFPELNQWLQTVSLTKEEERKSWGTSGHGKRNRAVVKPSKLIYDEV